MTIDPVSALSVAAAAVQFVDFSRKLVCKSRELHSSLDGVLRENEKTETVTMRLKAMAQELQPPRKPLGSVASRKASTPKTSARLQTICTECVTASDKLIDYLRRLKVPDGHVGRKWKSFRQALKSVWSKKEIDAMAQRLASLRAEIDTEVLILMRVIPTESLTLTSSQTAESFSQLTKLNTKVFQQLLKTQLSHEQFLQRFEDLGREQKSEFERLGAISMNQSSRFQTLDENTKKVIAALTNKQARAVSKGDGLVRGGFSGWSKVDGTREAATALVERDGLKRAARVVLDILESLRFPEMTHRHDGIAKAHAKTFRWIFEDPTEYHKPWDSFSQWLCQQSGLYWIQGKPASGKSTLMRYIGHHPTTLTKLKAWSGDAGLIAGTFFFWNSGSEEQRSQSGLFRTLLYEVLHNHRDLISRVFPEEWARKSDLAANDMTIIPEKWSQDQLQRAFKNLIGLANPSLKFCFFIDGLDEYDGDHGDIAEYIEVLSKESPHAKFCVSSRPLPVLQQVFVGVVGLKLQDLTADDIKLYVSDKLGSDRNMQRLLQSDPNDGNLLINEIVNKASGVFLWVALVVKSLICGLRNGDDMSHLLQRLFSLPSDIEQLFEHILQRIEPEYKEECLEIFQIFRVSGNTLNIQELDRTLRFTHHYDAIELAIEDEATFSSREYKERIEQSAEKMTRRLGSRCRGLLEIVDALEGRGEIFGGLAGPFGGRGEVFGGRGEAFGGRGEAFGETNPGRMRPCDRIRKRRTARMQHWTNDRAKLLPSSLPLPPTGNEPYRGPDAFQYSAQSSKVRREEEASYLLSISPDGDSRAVELGAKRFRDIVYLHRTARDYLEQPHVWSRILDWTADSGFDPKLSLLMSYVVQVKTSPVAKIFDTGQRWLKKIARLQSSATSPFVELVDELDKVLSYRSRQKGRLWHWSNDDPRWKSCSSPPPWEGDIISMAIQCGLIWYARAMVSYGASPAYMAAKAGLPLPYALPKKRKGLPLLAYAVSFHTWGFVSNISCDLGLVEDLLRNGSDPNEIFQGYTIWEYIIYLVHCKPDLGGNRELWLQIFTLMLQRGADPHACCVDDDSCFIRSVGYDNAPGGIQRNPNEFEHLSVDVAPSAKRIRGCDSQSWNVRNPHAYFHSVTAVVDDVFKAHLVPGHKELHALLEAKKKTRARASRKRRKKASNNILPRRPDWVS